MDNWQKRSTFLWSFFLNFLFLQFGFATIENFTTQDGLSQNTVQCITQDHLGYLWFGTQDGLSRFNGYEFLTFHHNPTDSLSINHNSVTAIFEDSENNLWIGTLTGLNRFNYKTHAFVPYNKIAVKDISKISDLPTKYFPNAANKYLLISCVNGLCLFDKTTGSCKSIKIPFSDSKSESIFAYDFLWQPGKKATLWLATYQHGLLRLTFSGLNISRVQSYFFRQHPTRQIRSLAFFKDTLWVGTNRGLFYANLKSEEIKFSLWYAKNIKHFSKIFIRRLLIDAQGKLWIGSMRRGLFVRIGNKISKIIDNSIFSLFMDRFNSFWIGTSGDGIFKYQLNQNRFYTYKPFPKAQLASPLNHIWTIFEDKNGIFWLGTNHGIKFFKPEKTSWVVPSSYKQIAKAIGDVQIRAIKQDPYGHIWVATLEKGVIQIKSHKEILNFSTHSAANFRLPTNMVYALFFDHQNNLWIGLNKGGLCQALLNQGEVKKIVHFTGQKVIHSNKKEYWVIDILETQQGDNYFLWLATWSNGLIRLNLNTMESKIFNTKNYPNLLSDYILTLYYAHNAQNPELWLGTYGGGLSKFDLKNGTFKTFLKKDGLANNVVYAILEDQYHNLWLSTNKGLSQFNPVSERFINYSTSDGLQSQEFNLKAAFKAKNGRLFFGGVNGLNYFIPKYFINSIPPQIDISEIIIYGKSQKKILYGPFVEPIRLKYNENALVINFVGLHTKNPQKNKYAYQMAGWGDKWIETGTQHQVTFLNLDPGTYSFNVKACNCDGIWNEQPKSLTIIIAPPFWKTPWAIFSYLFFVGLILYALHRRKIAQEIKIARIKEQERLKTKKEIDFDLHDELGGDILNIIHTCNKILFINNYSYAQLMEAIHKIRSSAIDLDAEIRELIWEVKSQKSTLEDLIIKLKSNADIIFDEDEYDFQLRNHITNAHQIEIPIKLRRGILNIFKEGMTNILKHCASCQKICLEFKIENDLLIISLSDDGSGFDPQKSFHGKGLKSMQMRADRLNGTLQILSQKDAGTRLIFSVKLT